MVTNAVLSIVSSIIGGGLVLAGQFFVKRAEDKRVWLIRLQEAASDLATSTGGPRRAASVRRENQCPNDPWSPPPGRSALPLAAARTIRAWRCSSPPPRS